MWMLFDVSQRSKICGFFHTRKIDTRWEAYRDSIGKHGLHYTWTYNPRNGRLITIEYMHVGKK